MLAKAICQGQRCLVNIDFIVDVWCNKDGDILAYTADNRCYKLQEPQLSETNLRWIKKE